MTNEFKKISKGAETRYILESETAGATGSGSIATVPGGIGGVRKRGQNLIAQEGDKAKVPATKPRNFVAKNATTGGAGAHKDKKKAAKQGDVKHKARELDVAEESDKQFAQRMKKKAAQPPTKGMSQKEKEDKGWAKPKEQGVAEAKGKLTYTPEPTEYGVFPDSKNEFVKTFLSRDLALAHIKKFGGKLIVLDQHGRRMKQGVVEGSLNESVIRSETIGPYTHELHKTPWGYQVRVYAGGKQVHSDITKPTEEKGQKSFDSNIAYTKKQLRINEQGVAEGAPELLKKEMPTHRYAEKLLAQNGVSKDDPDYYHHLNNTIKHLRQFGNIDLINKSDEQGVAEGSEKHECGHCHGTGRMVRDPDIGTDQECFVCDGTGYVEQGVAEEWSQKYKSSINCSHPKGFSQKAHCAGKKKHEESMMTMESVCPDCGMCQTHGNLNEIKKGAKDSNGFTKCWPGHHAAGTKKGKNGGQVRNCVPNESLSEGVQVVTGKGAYVAKRVEALKKMGYKVEKSHTHPNGDITVRLVDGVAESLGDDFAAIAKAKGFNIRKVGTPDQERQRTQDMIAQRKQAETEKLKGVDLAALQAKYDEMSKQYQALGGSNWQYADREQNLTASERQARSMSSELSRLSSYIHAVKQAQNIAEDHSTATGGWGQATGNAARAGTAGAGHDDSVHENPDWYNDEANSMTTAQLKSLVKHASKLRHAVKAMGTDTLEPWQQAKVTKAADYLDAVFNAVDDEHDMGEEQDAYMESLSIKLAEKLKPNDPVKKYIDDFSKAAKTPNAKGHHQFKNKSPEKVRQMAIAASYDAKNPKKKKK